MELSGEALIPAPRDRVWEALNDPATLRACIPGCQSLERNPDGDLDATVRAKVGPVSATFAGRVAMTESDPPHRGALTGEASSSAAGFARGSADLTLTEEGDATRVAYTVEARVGGKLAQLGGRLIAATAERYARDFFACLTERLAAPDSAGEATSGSGEPWRSEAIETFGEKELEENVHFETTVEEDLEIEAGKGTLGGPCMWGLIAFAVFIILLIALR